MSPRSQIGMAFAPVIVAALLTACSQAGPAGPATSAPPASSPSSSASSSGPASASSMASSASASSAPAAATADAATLALKMADTSLGSILVDGKGRTLYMFTNDSANMSACTGQCLVAWPPLIGTPTEGSGVDDSKLGSFTRADGTTQATYNDWPLYYWKDDAKPGDVLGQNVNSVWFVLDRDGEPVKE